MQVREGCVHRALVPAIEVDYAYQCSNYCECHVMLRCERDGTAMQARSGKVAGAPDGRSSGAVAAEKEE